MRSKLCVYYSFIKNVSSSYPEYENKTKCYSAEQVVAEYGTEANCELCPK